MTATEKLIVRQQAVDSCICVGLDSELEKIPSHIRFTAQPQLAFNQALIDATHSSVCAYKLNTAFYEARGVQGWQEMHDTIRYVQEHHPDIVIILDAKRADIGNTNKGYVTAFFDELSVDAITLHPYLGQEALQPFLERADKACIVLCRTSNPGSGEFQDSLIENKPLWEHVAQHVSKKWNAKKNCWLVVGATYPAELARVRKIVGNMPILVPGIGAQGGDLQKTLAVGRTSAEDVLIISSSREIIFASSGEDFAQKAGERAENLRLQASQSPML